ncbi:MAG: flagellar biosynthesis protein FlgE, partial [Alphaproteobacteria bacterium HGW-Alphaproteobacteria-2]
MTISSSLAASVSGLAANATKLATISDNIANSSTPGFKRSVTEFTSLVVG